MNTSKFPIWVTQIGYPDSLYQSHAISSHQIGNRREIAASLHSRFQIALKGIFFFVQLLSIYIETEGIVSASKHIYAIDRFLFSSRAKEEPHLFSFIFVIT